MGAPGHASGKQVFLPETSPNGSVAIPKRAADVTCYAKTRWRKSQANKNHKELKKLAAVTVNGAANREESRGAHAREDFPDRNDEEWMKHTLAWCDENGNVSIDYRPVHTYTMSNDIAYIEPKARVY